ncbi:cation diffusion facilitator family transporter [Methylocella sp.]|uniref:cation diffusion facilitator family transporter n=1 Tax=Methylocella sp. TaxID=1978226 RepID=UPI003783A40E
MPVPTTARRVAALSLAVSVLVLGVKYLAFHLTGSVALYSDALESLVNVATAAVSLVAVRVAAKPADAGHPYGHAKIEYLSAAAIGACIVVAALAILNEAWRGFLDPKPLDAPALGVAVAALATALNAGWSVVLIRAGRAGRSASLEADGRHLMSDVRTSIAVVAGVGLVAVTGVSVLDSLIAALVALSVLWSGWRVLRENAGGLMDEAPPAEDMAKIRGAIAAAATSPAAAGFIEAHDLRARRAGGALFVDLHLVLKGQTTVACAHALCDAMEAAIAAAEPGAQAIIHVEPEGEAKGAGGQILFG